MTEHTTARAILTDEEEAALQAEIDRDRAALLGHYAAQRAERHDEPANSADHPY